MRHVLLSLFAFALLSSFALASAGAEERSAQISVDVILAGSGNAGVSDELAPLADRLRRQFQQFNTFRKEAQHSVSLTEGETHEFSVPGGSTLHLTHEGQSGEGHRISIRVRGGSTTIVIPRGGLIFVGGPVAGDDTLIFAIRVR